MIEEKKIRGAGGLVVLRRTLCLIIKIGEKKAAIESQFPHLGGAVGRVFVDVVGGNQVNRYFFAFQLVEKFGEMSEEVNDKGAMVAHESNEVTGASILFDGNELLVDDVRKLEERSFCSEGNHCRGCGNHGDFMGYDSALRHHGQVFSS